MRSSLTRAIASSHPTPENKHRLLITNGDACDLDHDIQIPVISIFCGTAYNAGDCPLTEWDNSSSITLTIRAAKFCDGDRALVINGAITIQV